MLINGNTDGIKRHILEEMESLYEIECPRNEFLSMELAELLAHYTTLLGKEISLSISRSGRVMDVSVGTRENVTLPFLRMRRGTLGLSGVRCIHSHPDGSSRLSDVDIGTLLSARLDSMAAVAVRDGEPKSLCAAFIGKELSDIAYFGPYPLWEVPHAALMEEIESATQRVAENIRLKDTEEQQERAILVGVNASPEEMAELALLADTAGAVVVGSMVQLRGRDKAHYVGKGKLEELSLAVSAMEADAVILNDELSSTEVRNLEEALSVKVIDRTVLILDIFARHAKTKEGKIQVELAQLNYNLPRLVGEGTSLSRLGGGIGTRGPGETKLEVDRRRIRRRIVELEREIERLGSQRSLRREQRESNQVPEVALVGYTNAGKTSLLNAVANESQYAEDRLFATLDPVTRRVKLPSGREVLFTDTVGFIDKLPHELVSAFRSTLEEAARADLLLSVIDAANPEQEKQNDVVKGVLKDLGAGDKPILYVYNKADKLEDVPIGKAGEYYISAKTGQGMEALLAEVEKQLMPKMISLTVRLSYQEGAKLAMLKKHAVAIDIEYTEEHMIVRVELSETQAKRILG